MENRRGVSVRLAGETVATVVRQVREAVGNALGQRVHSLGGVCGGVVEDEVREDRVVAGVGGESQRGRGCGSADDGPVVHFFVARPGEAVRDEVGEGREVVVVGRHVPVEAIVGVGTGGIVAGAVGVTGKRCRAVEVAREQVAQLEVAGAVEGPVRADGAVRREEQNCQRNADQTGSDDAERK